jgi:hypothetical protein
MLYGEEKVKEMSRSLLPSAGRKRARRKKVELSRKLRRVCRKKLRSIREEDDYYESNLDFDYFDDGQYVRTNIVGSRRGADKLGPFLSWAEAKAAHIPDGEKYHYIKSLLPGSGFIIVDHAMGHLEGREGFDRNPLARRGYYYTKPKPRITEDQVKGYLREIIIDNRSHKLLNNFIKNAHRSVVWEYKVKVWDNNHEDGFYFKTKFVKKDNGPRTIRGLHDIDHFIDDIVLAYKAPSRVSKGKDESLIGLKNQGAYNPYQSNRINNPLSHPEWKVAATNFIEAWLKDKYDYGKLHRLSYSDDSLYLTQNFYWKSQYLWSW